DGSLRGGLEYSTDLFARETIERMVRHWTQLVEGILAHPERSISQLPLLSEGERRQLLVEWNGAAEEFPQATIIELIELQAEHRAEAMAVVYENQSLSYGELNRRANQLAHYLQGIGVGPETRVALCLERRIEMIIGMLGILKAGGAYVPLEAGYPPERLAYML